MRLFIFILLIALVAGWLGPLFWIGALVIGCWMIFRKVYAYLERRSRI